MPQLIYTSWPGIDPDDAPATIERFGDTEPAGLWFRSLGHREGELVVFELWSDVVHFRRYRDRAMGRAAVRQHLARSYDLQGPSFAFRCGVTATYPGLVHAHPRGRWIELDGEATVALFMWPKISLAQYREAIEQTRGVLAGESGNGLLFAADGPHDRDAWVVAHAWRHESARQAHVEHARKWNHRYIAGGPALERIARLRYAYYGHDCPTQLHNPVCPGGIA
ncbi:MAG: hypothetical protein K0V04_17595 [Deltaproteobacteria bacterium]|nr:hypothetical protein [Deltaproteobacteria bacterium]